MMEESRVYNLAPSEAAPASPREVRFPHVEMTDTQARTETPVRQSARQQVDGCWLLSEAKAEYLDGSEERLLEILRGADDLSSLSDELERSATNWPERYSLSRSRANVLRSLALTTEHTVLEVGAGCGPITRYLGETCGTVDALEPVRARARIARERTRDLPNVDVYIGSISDIPTKPAYDVIVVIGVLEWAGGGSRQDEPYAEFLSQLRSLLRPGGQIVCAIENRLGVKYLAGAPEDHTDRVFDGTEGYIRGGPARTFSRAELASLFASSGLKPTFYSAFPDYKMTRAVLSEELLASPDRQRLAWLIPWFPSPDWVGPRPHFADERSLWRSLVEDGVGAHFGNSFLVIATENTPSQLWDEREIACFYNTQRRAVFATQTRLSQTNGSLTIDRRRLLDSAKSASSGGLTLRVSEQSFVDGRDFVELLAESDDEALERWLRRWSDLVRGRKAVGAMDLSPHNFVVDAAGNLAEIDQEWSLDAYESEDFVGRGVFGLAVQITERTPPERWQGTRVRDVAVRLGALAGLDQDGEWIEPTVAREAEIQALVLSTTPDAADWDARVEAHRKGLMERLDKPLLETPFGEREWDRRRAAESARDEATRDVSQLQHDLRAQHRQLDEALRRVAEIEGSFGWRAMNRVRPIVHRVAPKGSARRRALSRALRTGLLAARTARKPFTKDGG